MDRDDVAGAELVELWRRCAGDGAGDPRERDWEELFVRLDARLRRLVRSQVWRLGDAAPSREDVEELAQEVYCRLLGNGRRALRRCRAGSAGELWRYLERVCTSVVVDRHRSRHALKRRDDPTRAAARSRPETTTSTDDAAWCPEQRLLRARAREHILDTCRAFASCPRLARRNLYIVESVVFEGRSIGEVAEHVGMRKSGVSSVLARLRRQMELPSPSAGRPFGDPSGIVSGRRVDPGQFA